MSYFEKLMDDVPAATTVPIDPMQILRLENSRMVLALTRIQDHHIYLNNRVGRCVSHSQTLKYVNEGLGQPYYGEDF